MLTLARRAFLQKSIPLYTGPNLEMTVYGYLSLPKLLSSSGA